jgi:hypothetical protein
VGLEVTPEAMGLDVAVLLVVVLVVAPLLIVVLAVLPLPVLPLTEALERPSLF